MGTRILQWSANSLVAYAPELKHFISTTASTPDVVCIQETWLKKELNFNLNGYNVERCDRSGGHGGIATCIKIGISYDVINNPTHMEALTIKIKLRSRDLFITNVYHPPHTVLDKEDYRK